jgi:hypothetical protein
MVPSALALALAVLTIADTFTDTGETFIVAFIVFPYGMK